MFDIGFLEIMVILIIALLVIGPERMPEVARKVGRMMGKMRRFVNSVKEDGQVQETLKDFKESMNIEEQKQQLDNINKELQSGLNFDTGLKPEEFQRPSFGSEEQSAEGASSQYNKAPAQPAAPKEELPSVEEPSIEVKHNIPQDTVVSAEPVTTTQKTEASAASDSLKS